MIRLTKKMSNDRKNLGAGGEQQAAAFLLAKRYQIIDQNIRFDFGEIDILAKDPDGTIVVVEVKTKISDDITEPHEAVNAAKQKKLLRLARAIEAEYPESPIRIDVISIVEDKIEHIKNAVWVK